MSKSEYIAKGVELIKAGRLFMPKTPGMIKVKLLDGPAKDLNINEVSDKCLKTMSILVYSTFPWQGIHCIYSIGEQIDGVYQCALKTDYLV